MKLTGKQKKFIKHNKKKYFPDEIANHLHIAEADVVDYLQQFKKDVPKKEIVPPFNLRQFLKKNWPALIFLTLLVGIAYINSLQNAFVSDDLAIYQIKNLGTLQFAFSSPIHFMGNVLYSIVYKIGGYNPLLFRLNNIFFHLGAVLAIYLLLTILIDDLFGFIVASLFAVHPILIESITWISGNQYVQSGFFCLCILITYILFLRNRKIFCYLLSLLFYALALLSSEKAVVFPIILLFFEISFGDLKKNWKYILIFFLVVILPTIYYANQMSVRIDALAKSFYQEKTMMNPFFQIPIAITSYLQLIIWPNTLTLYHSEMTFSQTEYIFRLFVFFVFLITILYGLLRNKQIFFWLSLFIISLLPTLTPFGISWIVAERYVYFGTFGILCVLGTFLFKIIKNKKTETLGYFIFFAIVVALLTRTIIRNFDWKDQDSLWIATGKTSPSDPKTHNNLGDVYGRQGDYKKSAREFEQAIKLQPNYADAYHNLGNVYVQMGKMTEAIEHYKQATKYNPKLWQSYQNLAIIYFNQKQYDLAEKSLKIAIHNNKSNANLYANLGIVYLQMGNKKSAKQLFTEALKIDPENKIAKTKIILIK